MSFSTYQNGDVPSISPCCTLEVRGECRLDETRRCLFQLAVGCSRLCDYQSLANQRLVGHGRPLAIAVALEILSHGFRVKRTNTQVCFPPFTPLCHPGYNIHQRTPRGKLLLLTDTQALGAPLLGWKAGRRLLGVYLCVRLVFLRVRRQTQNLVTGRSSLAGSLYLGPKIST